MPRITAIARALCMIATLIVGGLQIATLWLAPLSQATLFDAGTGVLMILLALGLMGTSQLSVFLVALLAILALYLAPEQNAGIGKLVNAIEVALIVFAGLTLLMPTQNATGKTDGTA